MKTTKARKLYSHTMIMSIRFIQCWELTNNPIKTISIFLSFCVTTKELLATHIISSSKSTINYKFSIYSITQICKYSMSNNSHFSLIELLELSVQIVIHFISFLFYLILFHPFVSTWNENKISLICQIRLNYEWIMTFK